MIEQDYIDIEMYLAGELPAERLADFLSRKQDDPAFSKAIAERQELNGHLIATVGEADFRKTLGRVMAAPREAKVIKLQPKKARRTWLAALSAAATVLLLILAFQFFNGGDGFHENLYGDHPPLALVERGAGTSFAQEAEAKFNAGEYAAAVQPLRDYLAQESTPQGRLALGIALMETDDNEEAERVFSALAKESTAFAGYANWYLALLALKKGNVGAVDGYLDLIPTTDEYLMNKAKQLRETL